MRTSRTFALFLLFILPVCLCSQARVSSAFIRQDTTSSKSDSLAYLSGNVIHPAPVSPKSTTWAILLSAVLPGAGQIYTERYLHAPVVWGIGYYLGRQWNKANDLYRDYGSRYAVSVSQDTVRGLGSDQLKYIRDFYHDERDRMGLYIGIAYVLNIIDAYVGASLYSFEVNDDLGENAVVRFKIPVR